MNKLDLDYQNLLKDILENGISKKDRTGTGTISVFGRQIRHNMKDGFPLLTTKKMPFKTIVTELLWFLRGDTNIKYLVDNGCHIWDGDAYKNYLKEYEKGNAPGQTLLVQGIDGKSTHRKLSIDKFIAMIQHDDEFAEKWGELGRIYGAQWREWIGFEQFDKYAETIYIDQIQNLINDITTNPDSRRLMVSAWNPVDVPKSVLPPCHYGFQLYTRVLTTQERCILMNEKHGTNSSRDNCFTNEEFEREVNQDANAFGIPKREISLMWNQRSVDTFLGLPFNIASYGLLLTMIADEVNMVPGELIGNLGDTHLYLNHIEQAKEQIAREPFKLPQVQIQDGIFSNMSNDIKIVNYQSHPTIKAPLSN